MNNPATCWKCGNIIQWVADYLYSEVYGDGDGTVSCLECPSCGAKIEYIIGHTDEQITGPFGGAG